MDRITVAVGTKENMMEDVHGLARRAVESPDVVVVTGKDAKAAIIEKASSLFLPPNLVLVLVDPEKGVTDQMRPQLEALRDRIHVIIYKTGQPSRLRETADRGVLVLEQDKAKRIEDKVRAFIRLHGKKMTNEAFERLKERIRDEAILEQEMAKLLNYVGDRKEIRLRDILAIVTETHEENMLSLFDALAKSNKKLALEVLDNLFVTMSLPGDKALLSVHGYLVRQTRLLLQTKDMAGVAGAHSEYALFLKAFQQWLESLELKPGEKRHYLPLQKPYYAFNLSKIGRRIPTRGLLRFLSVLYRLDRSVKSGGGHDRIRLEKGIAEA